MKFRNNGYLVSVIALTVGILWALHVTSGQRVPDDVKPPPVGSLPPSYLPAHGFVPNEETAVKIVEAVLVPILGEHLVASERPFQAELEQNVWTVVGTLPEGSVGGTAIVKVSKRDGRVLYATHEQ